MNKGSSSEADRKRRQVAETGLPMRDFGHSLPMALLKAREAVMTRFRPMLREHDVTEQQWRVLRALAESQEMEVTELARRSFILSPSLSRILQNLEARALVRRRTVREDQRRALICITAKGKRLFERVAPHSEAHYADITSAFGDRKLESLYRLLGDLEASLNRRDTRT